MLHSKIIALVPLLPFAVFLLTGLFGRKYLKNFSGILGTLSLLVAFVISIYTAYEYFFIQGRDANGIFEKIIAFKYTWLQFSPGVSIDMGVVLDPISIMMIVVVTFISLMVHIYSMG